MEADATVLVTLEPLEPLEPLGAWEGVAAAVLERVSIADVWSAKRECKGYVIT